MWSNGDDSVEFVDNMLEWFWTGARVSLSRSGAVRRPYPAVSANPSPDPPGFYERLVLPPPDSFFGDNLSFYNFMLVRHVNFTQSPPYPGYSHAFSDTKMATRATYNMNHLGIRRYNPLSREWVVVWDFDDIDKVFVPERILQSKLNYVFKLI